MLYLDSLDLACQASQARFSMGLSSDILLGICFRSIAAVRFGLGSNREYVKSWRLLIISLRRHGFSHVCISHVAYQADMADGSPVRVRAGFVPCAYFQLAPRQARPRFPCLARLLEVWILRGSSATCETYTSITDHWFATAPRNKLFCSFACLVWHLACDHLTGLYFLSSQAVDSRRKFSELLLFAMRQSSESSNNLLRYRSTCCYIKERRHDLHAAGTREH